MPNAVPRRARSRPATLGGMSLALRLPRGRARDLAGPAAILCVAFVVYLLCARSFDAGRADFFYLANSFLHLRTWLTFQPGPYDVVVVGSRVYVPFAPFPTFVLLPLVALVGPDTAVGWQPIVNSLLATVGLAQLWRLAGRLGVHDQRDRAWLVLLFGFSTATWWVTMRGGVWHTGHLVATILTFAGLLEAYGRRRPWVLGAFAGAAFLTRAPLIAALPYWGWRALPRGIRTPIIDAFRAAGWIALGFLPFLGFALWYNAIRFGNPLESGYAIAALPAFLEYQRALGLFGLVHLQTNLDYFLWHLPRSVPDFPFYKPDGLGLSVFLTTPGIFAAARARWRDLDELALGATTLLVLLPNLLYYGGGWYQFGFRYALDAFPFAMALCAIVAARRGIGPIWKVLIGLGVVVNLYGVWWNYHP